MKRHQFLAAGIWSLRRFPPPRTITEANAACFNVKDHNGPPTKRISRDHGFCYELSKAPRAQIVTKEIATPVVRHHGLHFASGGVPALSTKLDGACAGSAHLAKNLHALDARSDCWRLARLRRV